MTRIETEKDLDVHFEVNPKLNALCEILDGLKQNNKPSSKSKGKRAKGSPRYRDLSPDKSLSDEASTKKVVLVVVKTPKMCLDL